MKNSKVEMFMRMVKTFVLILFLFLVVECSSTKQVSLGGKMASEGIRTVMQNPSMKNGGLFEKAKKNAEKPSKWKVPKGYRLTKMVIDSLPMELLETTAGSEKVIIQLHGGAYIIGFSDFYRDFALQYCKISGGASVLSVDYRVAPQYTFPAALIDAFKAWNWLLSKGYKPENIIIAGDSAGGNLALALVMKLRDSNSSLPAAMICMSPWTDLASEGESYIRNRYKDPLFGEKPPRKGKPEKERIVHVSKYAGNTDLHDKYLSPAYGEFQNFPPMLIQVGTYEVLESDAVTVFEKAKTAQVDVTLTRYEGMFHVFQCLPNLPESKLAWKEVELFIDRFF
jgi:acetyl esterase/lipase